MMRAALLLCCLASAPHHTLAQEGENAETAVGCAVAGYDLILTNTGPDTLPEGSELEWTVRFARVEGVHVLTRPLAPGERVFLVGANGSSYLTTNTPCTVALR